jgi:hypothetical protein
MLAVLSLGVLTAKHLALAEFLATFAYVRVASR